MLSKHTMSFVIIRLHQVDPTTDRTFTTNLCAVAKHKKQTDDFSRASLSITWILHASPHFRASSCSSAFIMVAFSFFKTARLSSSRGLTARRTAKRSFARRRSALDTSARKIERSPCASSTPNLCFRRGTSSSRHLIKSSQWILTHRLSTKRL